MHQSVRVETVSSDWTTEKKVNSFLLFSSFYGCLFFSSCTFRKIVSTLALDVRTRRKYRCEYAGDRGTILINQIDEKTIVLI